MIQGVVEDYTEGDGCWGTQTRGYTLVSTRGSATQSDPATSSLLHTVKGDQVPAVQVKDMLGKAVWAVPALG